MSIGVSSLLLLLCVVVAFCFFPPPTLNHRATQLCIRKGLYKTRARNTFWNTFWFYIRGGGQHTSAAGGKKKSKVLFPPSLSLVHADARTTLLFPHPQHTTLREHGQPLSHFPDQRGTPHTSDTSDTPPFSSPSLLLSRRSTVPTCFYIFILRVWLGTLRPSLYPFRMWVTLDRVRAPQGTRACPSKAVTVLEAASALAPRVVTPREAVPSTGNRARNQGVTKRTPF